MKTRYLLQMLALFLSILLVVALILAALGKIHWLYFWIVAAVALGATYLFKGIPH